MSPSTVSKVLNGRTDVSAATRVRVEKLLRLHGYRRKNSVDRSSALLDLVFYELGSLWSTEIVRGAENVARGEGLSLVLSEAADGVSVGQDWLDGVLARNPVGVILVTSGLDGDQQAQLSSRGIPFVVMDPAGDPGDDVPSIGTTNWQGGLAATRHLLSLGHRRIAVVSGPRVMCSRARIDGYRAAMEEAGVPVDEDLVQPGTFNQETGYEAGMKLLSMPDRPTAIFTGNDLQAYGLYEAAWELGLRIPDDVSLVGFDDLTVSRWMGPSLTTVRQPLVQMAEAAVRLILDLRRGDAPELPRIDLATRLIVRSSTCPPADPVRPARPCRPHTLQAPGLPGAPEPAP